MTSISLKAPGLFVTGTDTGVGKTVVSCAIAAALRRQRPGARVGVCKPIASGCRRDREGLVSEDAEALAHWADCRLALDVINPVRYREPLAPAVAGERENRPVDFAAVAESLQRIAAASEVMVVEGVGGAMVPLDERRSVLDLMAWIGYPVVVVARPDLGTLNHTAMTCAAVRAAGLSLAGVVINRYRPDTQDLAEQTNPAWIQRQNRTPILATLPEVAAAKPEKADMAEELIAAAEMADWWGVSRAGGGAGLGVNCGKI